VLALRSAVVELLLLGANVIITEFTDPPQPLNVVRRGHVVWDGPIVVDEPTKEMLEAGRNYYEYWKGNPHVDLVVRGIFMSMQLAAIAPQERYPTAWAYEQACKTIETLKAERDRVSKALQTIEMETRIGGQWGFTEINECAKKALLLEPEPPSV